MFVLQLIDKDTGRVLFECDHPVALALGMNVDEDDPIGSDFRIGIDDDTIGQYGLSGLGYHPTKPYQGRW